MTMEMSYGWEYYTVREPDKERFKNTLTSMIEASFEIPRGCPAYVARDEHQDALQRISAVDADYQLRQKEPVIITDRQSPFPDMTFHMVRYAALAPGDSRITIAFTSPLDLKSIDRFVFREGEKVGDLTRGVMAGQKRRRIYFDRDGGHVAQLENDRLKYHFGNDPGLHSLDSIVEVVDALHESQGTAFAPQVQVEYHRFITAISLARPERVLAGGFLKSILDAYDIIAEKGLDAEVPNPFYGLDNNPEILAAIVARPSKEGLMLQPPFRRWDHVWQVCQKGRRLQVVFDSSVDVKELERRMRPLALFSSDGLTWGVRGSPGSRMRELPGSVLLKDTDYYDVELSMEGKRVYAFGMPIMSVSKNGITVLDTPHRDLAKEVAGQVYRQMLFVTSDSKHYEADGTSFSCALRPAERKAVQGVMRSARRIKELGYAKNILQAIVFAQEGMLRRAKNQL